MAKQDKLITYAYVIEECDLPQLDEKDLEGKIYKAQEQLRMLMGDGFYQDFLTNYKANTLSSVYESLFPYVKQYVAWQANEFWTNTANFKKHKSGFRVHREDQSEPASEREMAPILREAKASAQYYKKLLVDYMNNHSTDFPLYDNFCRKDLTGNSFHISAVVNKEEQPQPFGVGTIKRC